VNVEINVAAMADKAAAERLSRELAQATDGAHEQVERVLEVGRSRFGGH
jgi:formiminotetrahydrofolate cyclodeaminase